MAEGEHPPPKDITGAFLRFQRKYRERFYIKRHAYKWLRARELRNVVHDLVTACRRSPRPTLGGLN